MDSAAKPIAPSGGVLELCHFGVGFGQRHLLEDANASFGAGTLTALLGRNGTGKSTMLRALAALGPYSGKVLIDGDDLRTLGPRAVARRLAYVGTRRVRLPGLRCRQAVAMGRAPYTGWTGRLSPDDNLKVEQSLADVAMTDFANRLTSTLSDGEFQRIMIARALAQDTPVVLLDEPTSFLDLPNRYALCELLQRLAHKHGKCIIFSTHELDIALNLTDSLAVINPPALRCGPTATMADSGIIDRLFNHSSAMPPSLLHGYRSGRRS